MFSPFLNPSEILQLDLDIYYGGFICLYHIPCVHSISLSCRPHGQVNFGLENAGFGPISNQHLGGLQSTPTPPNSFSSMGGNPFG